MIWSGELRRRASSWPRSATRGATNWLGSIGLPGPIRVFGVLLFHFVLQIPMPGAEIVGMKQL